MIAVFFLLTFTPLWATKKRELYAITYPLGLLPQVKDHKVLILEFSVEGIVQKQTILAHHYMTH